MTCPQCAEVFKIAMDCINGRISDVEALQRLEAHAVPTNVNGFIKCEKCDNRATIWPARVCRDHDPDMGLSI